MHKDIFKHIKRNDRKIFRYVFDQYFHALSAFGYKYTSDASVAEDIVQETFISFWENMQNFGHYNAIKAFLYTTVRNKCLNHLKHQAVLKKHEASLVYELESEQFFSSHIIEEETFNRLFIEIRELPKAAQEIMLLSLNGLKNQEIADELNISVNTVKTQKKISYAKLKDSLGPVLGAVLLCF